MKKIILITLIFILQSIPSFGNSIDGKGLICEYTVFQKKIDKVDPYTKNSDYLGFLFSPTKVTKWYYEQINDDVETQFLMVDYETDENFIRWDSSYSKLEGEKFSSEYDYVGRKTLDFYQYDRISKKHKKNTNVWSIVMWDFL